MKIKEFINKNKVQIIVSSVASLLLFVGSIALIDNSKDLKGQVSLPPTTCVAPADIISPIMENTTLCSGEYPLIETIEIGAPQIMLDCNGAKLNVNDANIIGIKNGDLDNAGKWNVIIKNCDISNATIGIQIYDAVHNVIINNNLHDNDTGLYIAHTTNSTVIGNTTNKNTSYGISLYESSNNSITSNTADKNGDIGIRLDGSDTLTNNISNKVIDNNTEGNNYGISIFNGDSNISNSLRSNFACNNSIKDINDLMDTGTGDKNHCSVSNNNWDDDTTNSPTSPDLDCFYTCFENYAVVGEINKCSDEIDNDGDGLIDDLDFDCDNENGSSCITPLSGDTIEGHVTFCSDLNLSDGLKIGADDTVIDCTNNVLQNNDGIAAINLTGVPPPDGYDNVVIKNCTFENWDRGIVVPSGSEKTVIYNNNFNNSSNDDIFMEGVSSFIVSNTISGGDGNGIEIDGSAALPGVEKKSRLYNNNISNKNSGIFISESIKDGLMGNISTNNQSYGIEIVGITSKNIIAINNTTNGNLEGGIHIESPGQNGSPNLFSSNFSEENTVFGILLSSTSYNIFEKNYVSNNDLAGIALDDSDNNNFSENLIFKNGNETSNKDGIDITNGSDSNTFSQNKVYDNKNSGILAVFSDNNTLTSNWIKNNGNTGILSSNSTWSGVDYNLICNNENADVNLIDSSPSASNNICDITTNNNFTCDFTCEEISSTCEDLTPTSDCSSLLSQTSCEGSFQISDPDFYQCKWDEGNCEALLTVTCNVSCGDGVIEGSEQCDDGDTTSGDGCSNSCQQESGWQCTGEPSVCTQIGGGGGGGSSQQRFGDKRQVVKEVLEEVVPQRNPLIYGFQNRLQNKLGANEPMTRRDAFVIMRRIRELLEKEQPSTKVLISDLQTPGIAIEYGKELFPERPVTMAQFHKLFLNAINNTNKYNSFGWEKAVLGDGIKQGIIKNTTYYLIHQFAPIPRGYAMYSIQKGLRTIPGFEDYSSNELLASSELVVEYNNYVKENIREDTFRAGGTPTPTIPGIETETVEQSVNKITDPIEKATKILVINTVAEIIENNPHLTLEDIEWQHIRKNLVDEGISTIQMNKLNLRTYFDEWKSTVTEKDFRGTIFENISEYTRKFFEMIGILGKTQ